MRTIFCSLVDAAGAATLVSTHWAGSLSPSSVFLAAVGLSFSGSCFNLGCKHNLLFPLALCKQLRLSPLMLLIQECLKTVSNGGDPAPYPSLSSFKSNGECSQCSVGS